MRNVIAIIFGLMLGFGAHAGEKVSPPDLSGYPQVKGFLSCIAMHTNAAVNVHGTNFLLISEFYRMDCVGCDVLQYSVSDGGQVLDYHDPGDGSITQPNRRRLSPADFTKLQSTMRELPSTNQYPWLSSLVIVSHRDGTNWVIRSFGRSSTDLIEAPALRTILDIVGERPEAKSTYPF